MKLAFTSYALLLLQSAFAAQFRGPKVNVRAPLNDRRSYEYTTFENGLKVLAVQDPKASKSGFAVAVSAGSFYDPVELPGLAHFCEHLLFLGTNKYPDETAFDSFLSKHDGMNNAFTEQERTVFFNEISHAGFDEGMDRFAQFFISPLFKQELVGRELQAVNSEHLKNVPNQGRRLWELMRSTARQGSVVNRFYTGTTESLHHGDNKTVTALKKYHSENYCAPRMTLVMTSNMSVSQQLEIAHKHFDAVSRGAPHCSATPRDFGTEKAFDDAANLDRFIQLRTDSVPQLWMMWPLPPTLKSYKAQPASLLQYQLGYAGPNSLKSELKAKGLISNLGLQIDQSTAASLVFLTFDLTSDGSKKVDELTSTVFQYLKKVRAQSDDDVSTLYKTLKDMSLVTFNYQEAPDNVADLVSALAGNMQLFAPEDVLGGDTVIDVSDVKLAQQLLSKLTPDNVNIAVASKDFDEKSANKKNQYYKVDYAENPVPAAWRKAWGQHIEGEQMHAAPALKYVPTHLKMLSDTAGEIPKKLATSSGVEVWWLGKGIFSQPKAQLRVKLTLAKELALTPALAAMRKLHVELSNQGLEEPMEDLGACGLSWDLADSSDGYHLSMDGYSEHIAALVSHVASGIHTPPTDPTRFARAQQKLITAMEDKTQRMPYEHAMEALSVVTTTSVFSSKELIAALKAANVDGFKSYIQSLQKSGLRVQMLVTGNVDADGSSKLSEALSKALGVSKVLHKAEAAQNRALMLDKTVEVRMQNPISKDSNNAVVNAYQFGVPDVADRVKVLMLGKMISQPAYDELRTKQQLGYVVFAVMMPTLSTLQLVMIVQGAKKAPDDIDGRIEAVLDNFASGLTKLSASEFKNWKASLRSTINVKDQNMAQEADRIWSQIANDELCFTRKQMALDFLDSFETPAELAEEFKAVRVSPRKVSVRLFGAGVPVNSTSTLLRTTQSAQNSASTRSKMVLFNDAAADKVTVSKGQSYWPTNGICRIHREKQVKK